MTEGPGDLAGKAAEAANCFKEQRYAAALEVLEEMRQKKEDDPKILHNIAVVEYYRGSCTEPQNLLDALRGVKGACEELSRVAEQQLEGIAIPSNSNISSGSVTPAGNSSSGAVQVPAVSSSGTSFGTTVGSPSASSVSGTAVAGPSVSLTYTEEYDTSLPTLNTAILLYHMHQHARAAALVEPLYRNIEPLDEATAMTICLLLLEIWLESRQPDKAAGVLAYLEKAFGYLLERGEEGPSSGGSSAPDRLEPLDASATSTSLSLTGVAGEKESLSDELSSCSRTKLPAGKQRPKTVEDKAFPIPPAEFRLWLHLFKARLHLLTRNLKATKREVKCALNGVGSPLAPASILVSSASGGGSTTHLTVTQRQALFLKAQLEYSRRNYRKATKLLFSAAGSGNESASMRALFLTNVGCIHHQLGKHHMAALYFSQALNQANLAFGESSSQATSSSLSLPSFSRDKRLPILYNAALQHLLCGNYALAVRCFHESAAQYHNQPLLWLRLAECCVGAYLKRQQQQRQQHQQQAKINLHRGANANISADSPGGTHTADGGEQLAQVVGAPEWRRLLLPLSGEEAGATILGWSGLEEDTSWATASAEGVSAASTGEEASTVQTAAAGAHSGAESGFVPSAAAGSSSGTAAIEDNSCKQGSLAEERAAHGMLSLEYAAHCLRNASLLLDRVEAAPEVAPSSSSLATATFQPSAPQSTAQGGAVDSKASTKSTGDSLKESKETKASGGSSHASIAAFQEEKGQEISLIRQSVLANTAHLWLLCDHPLAALKAAEALIQVKGCSKESAFLSHTYAAEALCLLERPAEAVEHLTASMMQHSADDLESGEALVNAEGTNGGADREKEEEGVSGAQSAHFASPAEVTTLTGSVARASLYINLAAVYATQDEYLQAQQCALQALSIAPSSAQALLALVYVEVSQGHTDVALTLLKQRRYVPPVRPQPTPNM